MVARQFGAGAKHFAPVHQRGFHHVVGHQAVAALDQRQHGLAFADAAFAADDHAHAEDVHHAAQFRAARGKHHFQRQRGHVDEFHRHQRRLENRHARLRRRREKFLVRLQTAAENDARDFVGKQIRVARHALLLRAVRAGKKPPRGPSPASACRRNSA